MTVPPDVSKGEERVSRRKRVEQEANGRLTNVFSSSESICIGKAIPFSLFFVVKTLVGGTHEKE